MSNDLLNIDGTYVNPSWIHFIKPHELHSEANPGYKIYVDMGGETLEGTTTYKTERECRDAIGKLFGNEDEYVDEEPVGRILSKLGDLNKEEPEEDEEDDFDYDEEDDFDYDEEDFNWESV